MLSTHLKSIHLLFTPSTASWTEIQYNEMRRKTHWKANNGIEKKKEKYKSHGLQTKEQKRQNRGDQKQMMIKDRKGFDHRFSFFCSSYQKGAQ